MSFVRRIGKLLSLFNSNLNSYYGCGTVEDVVAVYGRSSDLPTRDIDCSSDSVSPSGESSCTVPDGVHELLGCGRSTAAGSVLTIYNVFRSDESGNCEVSEELTPSDFEKFFDIDCLHTEERCYSSRCQYYCLGFSPRLNTTSQSVGGFNVIRSHPVDIYEDYERVYAMHHAYSPHDSEHNSSFSSFNTGESSLEYSFNSLNDARFIIPDPPPELSPTDIPYLSDGSSESSIDIYQFALAAPIGNDGEFLDIVGDYDFHRTTLQSVWYAGLMYFFDSVFLRVDAAPLPGFDSVCGVDYVTDPTECFSFLLLSYLLYIFCSAVPAMGYIYGVPIQLNSLTRLSIYYFILVMVIYSSM